MITIGHQKALELMGKREINEQIKTLQELLGFNEVIYIRPVDNKLKCISTRIEGNNAMTGIVEEDTIKDFYFGPQKRLKVNSHYRFKNPPHKNDEEKRFEAWLIRHALKNNLRLHGSLENLLFVNSQWRFENDKEDGIQGQTKPKIGKQYIDLLAFDIITEDFVVIELKNKAAIDRKTAIDQAESYCAKFKQNQTGYSIFFLKLLSNMIGLYGQQLDKQQIDNLLHAVENNNKQINFVPMTLEPMSDILSSDCSIQIREIPI